MGQIENMKYQPPYTITSKIIYLIAQISENIGRLTVLEEIQDSLKLRKANYPDKVIGFSKEFSYPVIR